jgi:hypothetical protein
MLKTANWKHIVLAGVLVVLVAGAFWLKTRPKPAATGIPQKKASGTESTQALQRGIREHNAGAYDAALNLYYKVLQREPEST